MRDYCTSQGIEPPTPDSDKTTIAGLAPDVHRAADRAATTNGEPLLWRARLVLEQTQDLDAFVDALNNVLLPVVLDRTTDLPYPLIRFAEAPAVDVGQSHTGSPTAKEAAEAIRRTRKRARTYRPAPEMSAPELRPVDEPRPAPPGGWLNYWRNSSQAERRARAERAERFGEMA